MSVSIRLVRMGKKRQAYYRIVSADSRRSRDGRFLEIVGTYNPITKPALIKIHEDKMTKWLDEGAQPSDTVKSLLTQVGFTDKYLKAKKGEDVSGLEIRSTITERKKKTRQMKKAALAAAEQAKADAEAKKAEADAKAKAAEEAAAAAAEPAAEGEAPAEENKDAE